MSRASSSSATESRDFYIDLVFYSYRLKSFVLIELKTGKLSHQDRGQMDKQTTAADYELVQLMDKPNGRRGETTFDTVDKSQNHCIPNAAVNGSGIAPWGQAD